MCESLTRNLLSVTRVVEVVHNDAHTAKYPMRHAFVQGASLRKGMHCLKNVCTVKAVGGMGHRCIPQ